MAVAKPTMNMPEVLVFIKPIAIGFIFAEVWRVAFYLGGNFTPTLSNAGFWSMVGVMLFVTLMCVTYGFMRKAHVVAGRMARSLRFDLLIATVIGFWVNHLVSPLLTKFHESLRATDPQWTLAVFVLFFVLLVSPMVRQFMPKRQKTAPQLYFISDDEIENQKEDYLGSEEQAESFAKTVLASGAHPGLIFGVDGPWGVGKTSFINLAQRHWDQEDAVIVCRFEPLRYASEPDLTDRLIRDLSAAIRRNVFAPEFRPAASRYSRLIKGKADFSFLGFRLSLEPSQDTFDELLEDIDEVLRRIQCRVIIVIDDLDRLDVKTTNNVLFATRRTFKLSQATYILCYDTEILAGAQEEGAKAREFLEKFVTVKLSLFIDSSRIRDFLRRDWQLKENHVGSIPSDTMVKLGSVLNELADILDDKGLAANYLPLIGNMRKVKRFVNAMLLMRIGESNLGMTDFNERDLINLMLLHLYYPGLFRQIYAEETQNRKGTFSVRRKFGEEKYKNSENFSAVVDSQPDNAKFLLGQLFDESVLELGSSMGLKESVLKSRACFNEPSFRNLENYLDLIVHVSMPEPQETFILYQEAVDKVMNGKAINSILTSPLFRLEQGKKGEHAHDQFWRVLVNQSDSFTRDPAEDAIESLIDFLPHYSSIIDDDQSLRHRSIYSLLRLLDRAGWGRTSGHRLPNTKEHILEVASRIFGEGLYHNRGVLRRLCAEDRGVLGWNDLMIFRLQCSPDRQGLLHNLHSALIKNSDDDAETSGPVNALALIGMRKLSQEVFALFKRTYIDQERNFFSEVIDTPYRAFLGDALSEFEAQTSGESGKKDRLLSERVSIARTFVKSFVTYQLSNSLPPTGSGVGCGYYDEHGADDRGGIAELMNKYIFDFCFNPSIDKDNIFHFLDHCLSHLTNSFFTSDFNDVGYIPTKVELPGGFDPKEMGRYWRKHQELIRHRTAQGGEERCVYTINYTAFYSEDLTKVFDVLDELAEEASTENTKSDMVPPPG